MNTTAIYTEGQTIKITPTSTNPYNLNGRTLTVTISWIKDENVMRVELSAEDAAALKLRGGRTEITIDVNATYADWTIETIAATSVAPVATESAPIPNKKPVYTIPADTINNASWRRDNIERPGNGRIRMGAAHAIVEVPATNGNTLSVGLIERPAGSIYDERTGAGYVYDVLEISDAALRKPDGDEFMPADLIDRIEIEGYRRVWSGAYVWADDMDGWLTAAEAQQLYDVSSATVRQAINREVDEAGNPPAWARKSAGTWMVRRTEAEKRWQK